MLSSKAKLRKEMGKRIRNLRRSRGITIETLSEKIGITQSHLGLIERGERGVTIERLISLCRFFSCSSDFLLTGKDDITKDSNFGNSVLANSIDMLLSESEKQKLLDFVEATKTDG
ncbi:MAG: helix-turn-helix domain-containing protein [Defluviitaleaceae bacterium]|nr:helix-turn-helix domain-containing protein [Defluviitaleaceae bacterium]MCL2240530.1 helix-turn-helix domain-containing protein [Defluviitaleaceae bacterium]